MTSEPHDSFDPHPDLDAALAAMLEAEQQDGLNDPDLELIEMQSYDVVMAAAKENGLVPAGVDQHTVGSFHDLIRLSHSAESPEVTRFFANVGKLTTNLAFTHMYPEIDKKHMQETAQESLEDVLHGTEEGTEERDAWVRVVSELFPDLELSNDPAERSAQLGMLGSIAVLQKDANEDLLEAKLTGKELVGEKLLEKYGAHDAHKEVVSYLVNSAATLSGRTNLDSEDLRHLYAVAMRTFIKQTGHPISDADIDALMQEAARVLSSDKA